MNNLKIIIGLGNPGQEYSNTIHNLGFKFIDFTISQLTHHQQTYFKLKCNSLVTEINHKEEKIIFAKPQTYMNNSGSAVLCIKRTYGITEDKMFIVFDDLDIPLNKFKIQKGKYPKSHNGIRDILNYVNGAEINYIRIGVESRDQTAKKLVSGNFIVMGPITFDYEKIFMLIYQEMIRRHIL